MLNTPSAADMLWAERCYAAKLAPDGIWEIPLVLSDMSDAADSALSLPLPYRRLNAEVLDYLQDAAQDLPKKASARIVVYLPMDKIAPGMEERLNACLGVYRRIRLAQARKQERRALSEAVQAFIWGTAFMLACQAIRFAANFPDWPMLSSTLSEGLLVLGWVALWNPYERLLFSWRPEVRRRRLFERIAGFPVIVRPLPATAAARLAMPQRAGSARAGI